MHILVGPLQGHVTKVTCTGLEHAYLVGFAKQGHVTKMTFIMQQVNVRTLEASPRCNPDIDSYIPQD